MLEKGEWVTVCSFTDVVDKEHRIRFKEQSDSTKTRVRWEYLPDELEEWQVMWDQTATEVPTVMEPETFAGGFSYVD